MKILKIALLLSALVFCSCASRDRGIVGTWNVAAGGLALTAKIDEKTMHIVTPDGEISAPYVIDYTKEPAWIDIKHKDGLSKGVVDFLAKDAFWILSNDADEARPSDFKSAEQILIFKRTRTKKYTPKKNSHLGTWIGTSQHDDRVKLTIVPQMMKIESDGETQFGEYSIDYTKTPIWFDYNDGEDIYKAILEFIDKDSFRLSEPEKERPDSFAGLGDVIVLRRVND